MFEMAEELIIIISSSLFLLIVFTFLFSFVLKYQRKALNFLKEKELLQASFNQTLLESQLEIREQTLQYISGELHDNVGQLATLLKVTLNTISLENTETAQAKLSDSKDIVKVLITEVKSLSVSLGSDRVLRDGLVSALEAEISRINRTALLSVTLSQEVELVLTESSSIILYRMLQEILNNMIKHSKARNIILKIGCESDVTSIVVADDGVGFDVAKEMRDRKGSGLANLQKRAAMLNGQLKIESTLGEGSRFTIYLSTQQSGQA